MESNYSSYISVILRKHLKMVNVLPAADEFIHLSEIATKKKLRVKKIFAGLLLIIKNRHFKQFPMKKGSGEVFSRLPFLFCDSLNY